MIAHAGECAHYSGSAAKRPESYERRSASEPFATLDLQKIYYHVLRCRSSACSLQNAMVISRCANAIEESEQLSLSRRMYSVLQLVPYHVGDLQDAE